MGGLSSPLQFNGIIAVLEGTRGRIATVSTIANRLERGVSLVQRALDQMVRDRILEAVITHKGDQYRLRDGVIGAEGEVLPYDKSALPPVEACDDDGDLDDSPMGMTAEQATAAALWRARLGDSRWRDDPRALRERVQQQHCVPPFYNINLEAREI